MKPPAGTGPAGTTWEGMAMGTIKLPAGGGHEETLAELVKGFMVQGLTFTVTYVRGDWVIEVTGY